MKKNILGLAVFAIIVVGITYAIAFPSLGDATFSSQMNIVEHGNSKGISNPNLSYVLRSSLPSVPEQVMVYQAEKPSVSKESFEALGAKVGLTGPINESSNEFVLTSGNSILEIHEKSGRIALIDNSRWNIINGKDIPSKLPTDDVAIRLASDFLIKSNLMPKDAVLSKIYHPQVLALDSSGKTTDIPYEAIQVSFKRSIDEIPVVGAGSKLRVEIGEGGDVIQMYKLWRDYTPQEKRSIITPDKAFLNFKERGISGISTTDSAVAEINNVYLAYYESSAMEEQNLFLPVYVFEGNVENSDNSDAFTEYIPAIPGLEPTIPIAK